MFNSSANCTWTISTDANSIISLYVATMVLESHSACQYDNVSVYDGGMISSSGKQHEQASDVVSYKSSK